MEGTAKKIRWSRFLSRHTGRGMIVPIDHGLTMGPIPGLESMRRIESWIQHPGITGIIAHKGMVERLGGRGLLQGRGIMVHINGMTSFAAQPDTKELVTSVERAMRLGADALSLQLNFDGTNDGHNLKLLGAVADEAGELGLPVLTMLYDKSPGLPAEQRLGRLRHLMRACVELGTDALKLAAPSEPALIPALLAGVQEHTAVFFAGGEMCEDEELLELARTAVLYGSSGLCIGRNVFQRELATPILNQLSGILLESAGAPPSPGPFTGPGEWQAKPVLRLAHDG